MTNQSIKAEIHKLLNKLHDAKKGDVRYAMHDIADWMEYDLTMVGELVDSLSDGYEQLEFNHELDEAS